jgi:hypothetical protein
MTRRPLFATPGYRSDVDGGGERALSEMMDFATKAHGSNGDRRFSPNPIENKAAPFNSISQFVIKIGQFWTETI